MFVASGALTGTGCFADPPIGVSIPECSGDPSAPFAASDVEECLRSAGFEARSAKTSPSDLCANPGVVGEVRSDNGSTTCWIHERADWGSQAQVDLDAPSAIFRDRVAIRLANIECSLYPRGQNDDELTRLREALETLEAQL